MHFRWQGLIRVLFALALGASAADAAPRFRPVADDVFYMFMPIAWRDSDGDPSRFGDFGGMTASLPYLKSLGVTAVWMTPIFESPAYHGYQHGSALTVNPRFGTEAQFLSFVQAAHAESIKVFIDFVAYGISENSAWFADSHGNPASIYDGWLAYTDSANTSYLGCCGYDTWDGSRVGFIHWDLRNPEVTEMVTTWAEHWLDPNGDHDPSDGIDGFRLDHVSAYDATESPWGYDLAWWIGWAARLRAVNPDVFLFAEQADWGSFGTELLPPFDATFTKPFEFWARAAIAQTDGRFLRFGLEYTLGAQPPERLFLTTLGNHDVNRIASVLGGDPGKLRDAAAVLLLQPLPPVIYYGDELGMRGAKRGDFPGDASDIPAREPFKWNAAAGAPMSNYFVLNAPAYTQRVEQDGDGRSVEEESGVPGTLLEYYRTLGALRRDHPALRHGEYRGITAVDTTVTAFVKTSAEETLLVVLNLSGQGLTTALDLSAFLMPPGGVAVRDVQTAEVLTPVSAGNRATYALPLGPHAYRVLRAGLGVRDLRRTYADANRVVSQTSRAPFGDDLFELDQMFVRFDSTGLALALTGNLYESGNSLLLFFDAQPGGQSTLATAGFSQPPSTLPLVSGLVMDAGFQPEVALGVNLSGGQVYVDRYALATGGGGTKRYLGTVPVGDTGALTGGDNPAGLRVTYGSTNHGGVSSFSGANAASATDGFEVFVPWAELGLPGPGAPMSLMAMLATSGGYVVNQFLPPLAAVDTSLGFTPIDLNAYPGQQYLSLSSTTAALASLVFARLDDAGVRVEWLVSGAAGATFDVERRVGEGAWAALARVVPDGEGRVRVLDPDVVPGAAQGYRLVARESGGVRILAEATVAIPATPRLSLAVTSRNPGDGPLTLAIGLAGGARAVVSVIDVAGRRVLTRDVTALRAGSHRVTLEDAGRLPVGLYFVQLREGGSTRLARAVRVR